MLIVREGICFRGRRLLMVIPDTEHVSEVGVEFSDFSTWNHTPPMIYVIGHAADTASGLQVTFAGSRESLCSCSADTGRGGPGEGGGVLCVPLVNVDTILPSGSILYWDLAVLPDLFR
jgi:hypothetical protein